MFTDVLLDNLPIDQWPDVAVIAKASTGDRDALAEMRRRSI